jgi:predicted permease
MDGAGWDDLPVFDEQNEAQGRMRRLRRFNCISPGLFHTLGAPLIAGRDFTWTDIDNKTPVAIVSENLARELWQNPATALGKRVRVTTQDDWRQIIGVVGDVHDEGMNQDAPTSVYFPIITDKFETSSIRIQRDLAVVLRSPRAGSAGLIKDAQQAVWSVDANLPLANVRTLSYFYAKSMARISFTLVMLAIAAAMALVLGTVGLYGVIAYSVLQRTREIGIRAALGAQQQTLVGMFVRHGLMLVAAGLVCGLVVALAAMRLMSSLLFHVSPADPLTYLCVCLGLVAAAALASYIPSRRAATIDPVDALRAE